jgi:ribosomal protein S12 methylthiotransferase accessory factor
MESVERWHGEHARVPAWRASYEDAGMEHAYSFDALPRTAHSPLTPRWPIAWTPAVDLGDGTEYAVPRALVLLNEPDESPLDRGMLQRSSNGLASGNDLREATLSGLLEVIERDGVTCRLHALAAARGPLRRVRLESVEWPQARGLLARLDDAGVLPAIYDCTSDLGVPTFMADLHDLRVRHTGAYRGYGAHLDGGVALVRALTEAAQSRLVYISGARDDVFRDDLARVHRADSAQALAAVCARPATVDAHGGVDAADPLEALLERLDAAGLERILRVDLTAPGMDGVAAVRVLVPGLEGYRTDGYRPGARARRLAAEGR